jgi:hypothetical protein
MGIGLIPICSDDGQAIFADHDTRGHRTLPRRLIFYHVTRQSKRSNITLTSVPPS